MPVYWSRWNTFLDCVVYVRMLILQHRAFTVYMTHSNKFPIFTVRTMVEKIHDDHINRYKKIRSDFEKLQTKNSNRDITAERHFIQEAALGGDADAIGKYESITQRERNSQRKCRKLKHEN